MKTKTLIIAIVAMFAIGATNANTTKKETATAKAEVMAKVKKEMKYPELAIEENLEGNVWVAFRVDDEGKFQVFQANSANPKLKDIVVKKLERIKPPNAGLLTNELYHVKFSFKLR